MSNLITLSINQIQDLQLLRDQGDYPGAYNYLRDIVQARVPADGRDPSYDNFDALQNRLDSAAKINGNTGDFSSEYVRGATEKISQLYGKPLSEAEVQVASDSQMAKIKLETFRLRATE